MALLRVALLQMAACGYDQAANQAKGEQFCREAARMGADIALFPEMWNIGYTFGPPDALDDVDPANPDYQAWRSAWHQHAVSRDGDYVNHFRALARELNLAIALTYLERWPSGARNSVSLIDRHGEIVLTYAKIHTCEWSREEACTPGDDFYVAALDTAQGAVQVGAMICFDREFPEPARILMLKGAELILVPNACEIEINRVAQLRCRAYENMVAIALTNYVTEGGYSVAFDGMAFDANGSRDMTVIQAGTAEGVYLATFDLERLRAYRQGEVWGNAFRKPRLYGPLVAETVTAPFARKLARR